MIKRGIGFPDNSVKSADVNIILADRKFDPCIDLNLSKIECIVHESRTPILIARGEKP